MATYTLEIPYSKRTIPLKIGDNLKIKVTADCEFCGSDTDDCFPYGFLPANAYTATNPPTVYGGKDGFLALNPGSIPYNAVTSGDCNVQTTDTAHSIVVS